MNITNIKFFKFWKYLIIHINQKENLYIFTCNWISAILFHEKSNSFTGTLACLRYRRKPSSSGLKISKAWPLLPSPRAVLPTRWIYS